MPHNCAQEVSAAAAFRQALQEPQHYGMKIDELFPVTEAGTTSPRAQKSYIVCFSNRCGSNLLSYALATDPRLGFANEYFNIPPLTKAAKQGCPTLYEYVAQTVTAHRSSHGWFGTKLGWFQLEYLLRRGVIPAVLTQPRYLYIRRRDLLGQAISFYIANHTKKWTKESDAPGRDDVPFDRDKILALLASLSRAQAHFEAIFAAYAIAPVRIYYEDLLSAPEATLERIAQALGIHNLRVDWAAVSLKPQRTDLNEAFRQRIHDSIDASIVNGP